jgi:hypothetical protein
MTPFPGTTLKGIDRPRPSGRRIIDWLRDIAEGSK